MLKTEFCFCCMKPRLPEEMTAKSGRRLKCCYCAERAANPGEAPKVSKKPSTYKNAQKRMVSGKYRPPW